jgi:hypothetical protein
MTSATYMAGTLVTSTATFVAESTGLPADPTTVSLKYELAPGTVVAFTYPSGITKVSTGVYQYEVDTTGAPAGTATLVWKGTGAVQAINADTWTIEPSPL